MGAILPCPNAFLGGFGGAAARSLHPTAPFLLCWVAPTETHAWVVLAAREEEAAGSAVESSTAKALSAEISPRTHRHSADRHPRSNRCCDRTVGKLKRCRESEGAGREVRLCAEALHGSRPPLPGCPAPIGGAFGSAVLGLYNVGVGAAIGGPCRQGGQPKCGPPPASHGTMVGTILVGTGHTTRFTLQVASCGSPLSPPVLLNG